MNAIRHKRPPMTSTLRKVRKRLRTIEALVRRDGDTCAWCGRPIQLWRLDKWAPTLDHIRPRSKGGNNKLNNLRLTHECCNQQRGNSDHLTLKEAFEHHKRQLQ